MFGKRRGLRDYMVGAFVGDIYDPASRKPDKAEDQIPAADVKTSEPVAPVSPNTPKPE